MAENANGVLEEDLSPQVPHPAPKTHEHAAEGSAAHDTPAGPKPNGEQIELDCCHILGRNLVVNIDGTANQFGNQNTNVIEMYSMMDKEDEDNQHTWYNSGIGTYAQPQWTSLSYAMQVISHKIDMAIAWNFEKTVQEAYRWLSNKYKKGDNIFLFGFSRGAFQVRALSAMIDKVGLIHEGNESQIPFAYELYADPDSGLVEDGILPVGTKPDESQGKQKVSKAARFKQAFSRDVKVHFVGVWDTVSSIGVARGKKILPGTTDGMKHVCYFRQALALDERRVKFQPEYAYGGMALDPNESMRAKMIRLCEKPPHTIEVWFAGTHSDIGGGNVYNAEMNRSRPPLRWMAEEAKSFGLRMKPFERELDPEEQINFVESLTGAWHLFEHLWFERLTFSRTGPGNETTSRPHWGSPRMIHKGQKIHSSLILGDHEYIPKASLPKNSECSSWAALRKDGLANQYHLLEIDINDYAEQTVGKFVRDPTADNIRRRLKRLCEGEAGAQALYDEVVKVLELHQRSVDKDPNVDALLDVAVEFLNANAHPLSLGMLWDTEAPKAEPRGTALTTFLRRLTVRQIRALFGPTLAISSHGTRLLSGRNLSSVSHFRIWDTQTGDSLRALNRNKVKTRYAAISSDGTSVVLVSCSKDDGENDLVEVWDTEMGEALTGMKGPTGRVSSVAISSDRMRVVSGSREGFVRVWDAKTGEMLRLLEGHTGEVNGVAISSDGTCVVSGSDDLSVRIWDAETGDVLQMLEGHTEPVQTVAISSDKTRVVSGSKDGSLRVWDAQTGAVLSVLNGHTNSVSSLAISSDGTRVVSGSHYSSVRIWDAQTGAMLGVLNGDLNGHWGSVTSVAILPNNKRVLSASSAGLFHRGRLILSTF